MRMMIVIILVAAFGHLSACGSTPQREAGGGLSLKEARRLSDSLSIGLTEQRIVHTFGVPGRTEQSSCGSGRTGTQWPCRILEYSWKEPDRQGRLEMMFRESGGTWFLNSWQWH